ncbi:MAG: hypothetical protein IKC10_06920 [Alphaproteobacteria bacterium]|nr:hypothetical protein [Alphaproteobacteria bacterium]
MENSDFSTDDFDKLLDDFIASQLSDNEDILADIHEKNQKEDSKEELVEESYEKPKEEKDYSYDEYIKDQSLDAELLAMEERRLYDAMINLMKSSVDCAKESNIEIKKFTFDVKNIIPRFNPKKTKNLSENILYAWDLLLKAQPERISTLPPNPSDEQILTYAEKTTNKNLMMALISYVESLIEIDACEIAYNLRKVRYQKYKIEKRIYEEELNRREKIRLYIQKIKKENFPIDAELLVNNYFKTARKDSEGARKILETNPSTFAPIQINKIPNKFFGLIKATPEDGKRINKKIGKFLKKLKV